MIRSRLLLVLGVFSLAAGVWAAKLSPVIRVVPLARVSVVGPLFSIGDVARVIGEDETRCERVRKVPVGTAPSPERKVQVTQATLQVALRKAGYVPGEVVVVPGETLVSTESQSYPLQNLLPAVRADILKATGEASADVQVEPSSAFDKMLVLPQGKVTNVLRPPTSGRYEGSVMYVADLFVDGRKVKTLPLRVTVHIERPAVVVTHRVERGEKFEAGRVELRKVSEALPQDPVTVLSQALGKTAARAVFPGTVLRFQDIADPPLIKRGQEVTCRGSKGNVTIEVTVKAMEDGKIGRVIRVQNTGSQKLFKAKVVDETTVEAVAGP